MTAAVMVMPVGRAVVRAQRTTARLVYTSALATVVVACQPPAAPTTAPAPTRVDARRAGAFLDTLQQRTF